MTTKINISLPLFIAFLSITFLLLAIFTYSFCSGIFFTKGLDSWHEIQLLHAIRNAGSGSDVSYSPHVFESREKLPQVIRESLPENMGENRIYRISLPDGENREEIYFIIRHDVNGRSLFAVQKFPLDDIDIIRPQITFSMVYALAIGGLLFIVSLGVIAAYSNKIRMSIQSLCHWASSLSLETIEKQAPDFGYSDLNQIAALIQESLRQKFLSLQREHLFWRYCGHELRTPISVMRIGLDLLEQLSAMQDRHAEKMRGAIRRLRRSAYLMSQLIESLLWLGRDDTGSLPAEPVDLAFLIKDVSADIGRIFPANRANLHSRLEPFTLRLPEAAARIVLGNAIKNAFQHSLGGQIRIIQKKNTVYIINPASDSNGLSDNTGFGLGLEITERLTAKIGWKHSNIRNSSCNIVKIVLFQS